MSNTVTNFDEIAHSLNCAVLDPYMFGLIDFFPYIFCYLMGSIPFGLILTKIFVKQDIRSLGSGNIGATNVLRTGNKSLALATLLLDALKSGLSVLFIMYLYSIHLPEACVSEQIYHDMKNAYIGLTVGLFAILGHCFPIWLKFKGGKGVATGLGALLVAAPYAGLAACLAWIATAKITKYSSLSALIAFLIAPIITLFIYGSAPAAICAMITLLIWIRHKDNIKRLLKSEEPKIGQNKEKQKKEDSVEPVSK
tara:strand:- start:30498 stop:31256 length:759 start_codon:yes stop_codon:yes gene_type:complete